MSSRIHREDDIAQGEAQSIQWRPHGQAAPVQLPGFKPRTGSLDAPASDSDAMQQQCAAAHQKGLAAGEAAATQRAKARFEPALASFSAMVAELAALRIQLRAEAEESAVALALHVARRILHREVSADPEAILGLVKAAFQKCDGRATQRLRVSPPDAEVIRENQARLNLPPALEIVPDRNLSRGSVIFETSRGELDASVDTQLAEIERGLADVLNSRALKRRQP